MEPNTMLLVLGALTTKHLVADFLYQPPFMYKNKGTYGHPGGVIHALAHVVLSAPIFYFFPNMVWILFGEFMIHYHVDWAKMNLNRIAGWGPLNSENFWRLLGIDQWLHGMTYVWMIWMAL